MSRPLHRATDMGARELLAQYLDGTTSPARTVAKFWELLSRPNIGFKVQLHEGAATLDVFALREDERVPIGHVLVRPERAIEAFDTGRRRHSKITLARLERRLKYAQPRQP